MYTELFIMIKRQLQLIACLILLQNLHPSSSTLIDLCSNVRQMSEVCAASSNVSVSTANTSCQCVGERGPRGQRGRPGKNGEIDYDILNERIDARLEGRANRVMTLPRYVTNKLTANAMTRERGLKHAARENILCGPRRSFGNYFQSFDRYQVPHIFVSF